MSRFPFFLVACTLSTAFLARSQTAERPSGTTAAPINAPKLRLIDLSVDTLIAAGGSTLDAHELEAAQGGGHDPKQNGFTLQQAEISLSGVIDPFLRGEAHVVASEDAVEVEEAFLTTTGGWAGWNLKAGYFLTEFGRVNASHPHTWGWVDQPVVATRLLGGEGLRNAGVRVSHLLPLPWYSEILVGAQNAGGEFAASFLGGEIAHDHGDEHAHEGEEEHDEEHVEAGPGIGGRAVLEREAEDVGDLLYHVRWSNSGELGAQTTALLGFSGLVGPNASGEDTSTWMAGADLTLKWTPARQTRGFPFVKWETEWMYRDYEAGAFEIAHPGETPETIPGDTLKDYGVYSQVQYGFAPGWVCGLRGEYVTGEGESVGGRDQDPYRADRIRVSPMISWMPSEFSRVRLQYNLDDGDALEETGHTVWISLEGLWGIHPAHTF